MDSSRHLNQDETALILENDDDYSPLDSNSEQEDCVIENDVQSDNEDAMVDYIEGTSPISRQEGGVDSFDQMCSSMSTNRKTNRWPMAVFYGMLNMSFVNSYIIYCHNMIIKLEKPMSHDDFMKKITIDLTTPWMQKRLEAPTLKKTLRENINNVLKTMEQATTENDNDEPASKKRRYCGFCSYKKADDQSAVL